MITKKVLNQEQLSDISGAVRNACKKELENSGRKAREKCESRNVRHAWQQLVVEAGYPELDGDTSGHHRVPRP